MSKKLTPLETWYLVKKYLNEFHHRIVSEDIEVETIEGHPINIIESALKRLEKIDNTTTKMNDKELIMFDEEVGKRLKALEIIKEKGNFLCLHYSEYENKYYIYDAELYMHNELTKEEYELLKEILK